MSMRAKYTIVAALIFLACLSCVAQDCSGPALRGSFLQPALADAWTLKWTLKQWRDEFHYMRDARLNQMVIQWAVDSKEKTTIYPSGFAGYTQNTEHDVVERARARPTPTSPYSRSSVWARFARECDSSTRLESFNTFNHPQFCGPDTTYGDPNFGKIFSTGNGPREVQMALKLYW